MQPREQLVFLACFGRKVRLHDLSQPVAEEIDQLRDIAARILRDMVPYKRPRLTATKVSGDRGPPTIRFFDP